MIIKLRDYLRIHGIITALLDSEDAKTDRACLYYASYGAYILYKQFNLDAVVVSGAAVYHLGDDNNILLFGDIEEGHLQSHKKAFHAWVEVDGYLIDFMAPTFARFSGNSHVNYPARMMQKSMALMNETPNDLQASGDFFLLPNPTLTEEHASFLTNIPFNGDLAEIGVQWFRKAPKKIPPQIGVMNQAGEMEYVKYKEVRLSGVW